MNDSTEYKIDTISALTDTGTSCIIGPTSAVASIRNQILNLATNVSTSSSWDYLFDCSSKSAFPEFELLYGGYWFKVTADDYTIEVSSSSSTCALCLSAYDNLSYWILGDAFMRGWYNIHDHGNLRMGFVPFTGSVKTKPTQSLVAPTTPLPLVDVNLDDLYFGMSLETFLVVCLVILLLIAMVTICLLACLGIIARLTFSSKVKQEK